MIFHDMVGLMIEIYIDVVGVKFKNKAKLIHHLKSL